MERSEKMAYRRRTDDGLPCDQSGDRHIETAHPLACLRRTALRQNRPLL